MANTNFGNQSIQGCRMRTQGEYHYERINRKLYWSIVEIGTTRANALVCICFDRLYLNPNKYNPETFYKCEQI